MNKEEKNPKCRMCGKSIPPLTSYPAEHCWMCVRDFAEKGHSRHYVHSDEGFWEEVPEIAGLFALDKRNELIIEKAMAKRKIELEAIATAKRVRETNNEF